MGALLRHLGAGLGLGLVTGAVARGFMALLTAEPQFSWQGTAFVLGVFAVAGLALAAAHDAKGRRRSRWWKVLAGSVVLLALVSETADEPFTLRTAAGFVVMFGVCAAVAAGARAALTGWDHGPQPAVAPRPARSLATSAPQPT